MAASTLGNAWLVTADSDPVPKKKKRIVKHKKKAWRVTSDVADVERFLESERLEERLGAPFSERPDESIFVLDAQADDAAKTEKQKNVPTKRRKLKEIGPLRCYSILTPSSAVSDPLKKRNRVRTPAERQNPIVARAIAARRAEGKIPARFVQSLKDHARNEELIAKKKKPEKLRSTFDFDIWGEKGDEVVIGDAEIVKSDLSAEVKKYTLEQIKKRVYSRPGTLKNKTSSLPAVEYPHPGMSYNPTFEDHQDLLLMARKIEVSEIEKEEKLRRRLGPMCNKLPEEQQQAEWMTEMSQGLVDDAEPPKTGTGEATEELENEAPVFRPTKPKTMKQKRKFKLHKLREIRRRQIKERKKKMAAVDRLRSIRREISTEDKLSAARIVKRQKLKEKKMAEPKILGRHKYEAPPLEVNLSEEIAGNLRGLKVEGHVLLDRYKSLQRRNIIEPRIKQRVIRKYKLKKYIKRHHKEPVVTK